MELRDRPNLFPEEKWTRQKLTVKPPLRWRIKVFFRNFWILIAVFLIFGSWKLLQYAEANHQQQTLANAFFDECAQSLHDTNQIPAIPDEALHNAERKLTISDKALRDWAPQVSAQVKGNRWIAKILFVRPTAQIIEKNIGPASVDAGYDNPNNQ